MKSDGLIPGNQALQLNFSNIFTNKEAVRKSMVVIIFYLILVYIADSV